MGQIYKSLIGILACFAILGFYLFLFLYALMSEKVSEVFRKLKVSKKANEEYEEGVKNTPHLICQT